MLRARITPTLAVGYAYMFGGDEASSTPPAIGAAYEALGGLRCKVIGGDRIALLLGAEAGLRHHAVASGATWIVPVLASDGRVPVTRRARVPIDQRPPYVAPP